MYFRDSLQHTHTQILASVLLPPPEGKDQPFICFSIFRVVKLSSLGFLVSNKYSSLNVRLFPMKMRKWCLLSPGYFNCVITELLLRSKSIVMITINEIHKVIHWKAKESKKFYLELLWIVPYWVSAFIPVLLLRIYVLLIFRESVSF